MTRCTPATGPEPTARSNHWSVAATSRVRLALVATVSSVLLVVATFALGALLAPSTAGAQPPSTPTSAPSSEPPSTTSTTAPPTEQTSTTSTTSTEPTTTETTAVASTEDTAPSRDPAVSTTLPTGPPPGFTEEQFQTFVDVVTACGANPGAICQWVLGWSGNQTLAEGAQWIADVPIRLLIIVAVAICVNWIMRRVIARYVERINRPSDGESDEDPDYDKRRVLRMATASASIASAATVAIFTIAIFVALGQLDINLGPLIAGAGIIGVALGFGAQNVVRDVLAGIFVLVEDQYGIGDIIDVGRASGQVEGISLRVTKIRDVDGTLWFVPNGRMSEVGNKTQRWSRVILDVDVAYGADHHEAERLIKEAADGLWRDPKKGGTILEEPEMWGVENLGKSSVSIRIAVKSAPADQWKVARELRSRIKDSFDAAGIEIPFPQQAVWVRAEAEDRAGPEDGPGQDSEDDRTP